MAWRACTGLLFDGVQYDAGDEVLRDDQEAPCNMEGLAVAGMVLEVPAGYEMWRPDISAQWCLRELVQPSQPPSPEAPVSSLPTADPDPLPAPAAAPAPQPTRAESPKRTKRKLRRRRSGG